ncbi:Allene oxide synthase 3 [Vitis vinifera]|uniref:Allene oxide synthase 3 n=1 Tax=Vitis vinifera TaxID=29760 RepID=A0A438ELE7_VITVI|nr:Allene oxide synthase 3 [Vitis vinifera]
MASFAYQWCVSFEYFNCSITCRDIYSGGQHACVLFQVCIPFYFTPPLPDFRNVILVFFFFLFSIRASVTENSRRLWITLLWSHKGSFRLLLQSRAGRVLQNPDAEISFHSLQSQHAARPLHLFRLQGGCSSRRRQLSRSFRLFKVEKRNVLDGTFMPSTDLTGGYRVLAFLDPSEPKHDLLKRFSFSLLASRHRDFIPVFRSGLPDLFTTIEDDVSSKGKANFNNIADGMYFNFVFRLICGKDPSDAKIRSEGPNIFSKWLFLQLSPLMTLGLSMLPNFIEDLLLHTFPLPPFLVKSDYNKLYKAFYESASSVLDEGERMGLNRDEACHNLVFLAGFSTFGGMKVLFPPLIKWVGLAGEKLHRELADEIRTVVKAEGGVTFAALDKMALTKSVVYEALRIAPPVPFQYGKAREDMVIHSHDAAFEIKKGEMIFGYQPFATKDPKVFENPEDFVAHRFMGEGEKLLKYVYWSNGRETDNPTAENKQCSGKDLVVLISKLMLVEIFLRYDTFEVESGTMLLGSAVLFKSLTKSSYT